MDASAGTLQGTMRMLFDIFMVMVLIAIFYVSWLIACAIVPQSQIDAVERIGKWAKAELDKRELDERQQRQ